MKNNTVYYSTPKQGTLPAFFSDCLEITDPVITFDRFMEGINLHKYLTNLQTHFLGRIRYNPVNMLKTVLFGFMDVGYISLRKLEENCKVNIRYQYLMDGERPSYRTFGYFINNVLRDQVENLFTEITQEIIAKEHVDLEHVYIDGTKLEANANKYSWVWRKGTEKSRYRLYRKISDLFKEINAELSCTAVKIEINTEYAPAYLELVLSRLKDMWNLDEAKFVHGTGHRKSFQQKAYENLKTYLEKLKEYEEKIHICGEERNSYSKTDHSATFMRIKKDYMGNDQLLPAYNIQVGVADEYIAVVDVNQYRSDMDCFVPLLKKFYEQYGKYPKYPVADAGYGSFNNYLFCAEQGMEPFVKFPLFFKETKNKKFHENPFRSVNFKTGTDGTLICPNGKHFHFLYKRAVRGNRYGRQEEIYECEDCSNCPYAEKCKKTPHNRRINLNEELTSIHQEVIQRLSDTRGLLLRRNRAIQAEGTFGIMKNDREYDRIVRRGIESVKMEVILVAIGHNLYKYYKKQQANQKQAA